MKRTVICMVGLAFAGCATPAPKASQISKPPITKEEAIQIATSYARETEPNLVFSSAPPTAEYHATGTQGWEVRVYGVPRKDPVPAGKNYRCGSVTLFYWISPDGAALDWKGNSCW